MRYFRLLFCAALIAVMASCGSGKTEGYDASLCSDLAEKIDNNEQLTEEDYDDMITQMLAAAKELHDKKEAIEKDPEKLGEFQEDEGNANMWQYAFGFQMYLRMHQSELPASVVKKLQEAEKEMRKVRI